MEAEAKACLLQYLRDAGELNARVAVALELSIAKQANRADLALINDGLQIYEIKTHKDTLKRLEAQLRSYEAAAQSVTLVAASTHISALLSRLSPHVGIFELVHFGKVSQIRVIREARQSPEWKAQAALALLPAHEIKARLLGAGPPKLRAQMLVEASCLPSEKQKDAVIEFLRQRYRPSTRTFLRLVRKRAVTPKDLPALHIWSETNQAKKPQTPKHCPQDAFLSHVAESFGPVPDEVRLLLEA